MTVSVSRSRSFGTRWNQPGGQFVINTVPQAGGHQINLNPADVASAVFTAGITAAADAHWARDRAKRPQGRLNAGNSAAGTLSITDSTNIALVGNYMAPT